MQSHINAIRIARPARPPTTAPAIVPADTLDFFDSIPLIRGPPVVAVEDDIATDDDDIVDDNARLDVAEGD